MFLAEPDPTPLDLRFRIFGTPVRVHPLFWLLGGVFGYFYLRYREHVLLDEENLGWSFLALWVGWLFVSVLIHELGHITMARVAGRRGRIVLHSLGGLALWEAPAERRWQRIAIAAAGPSAGFVFYALVVLVRYQALPLVPLRFYNEHHALVLAITESLYMLAFMNLLWNLLNLIPVWPLDGGQISLEVFSGMMPMNGYRLALGLSVLLAGGAAVYSGLVWAGIPLPYPRIHPALTTSFLGLMAWQNLQMLFRMEAERRIGPA